MIEQITKFLIAIALILVTGIPAFAQDMPQLPSLDEMPDPAATTTYKTEQTLPEPDPALDGPQPFLNFSTGNVDIGVPLGSGGGAQPFMDLSAGKVDIGGGY